MRGMRFVVAGGLLAVGMIAVVQAQPGGGFGGFGGGGGNPAFLVGNKAVQEDIKATDEQVTKLKDFGKEFFPKIGEIYKDKGIEFGKGAKGFGKIDDETRAKMAEANAEVNKVAYKDLGEILKPEQVNRLKQISRQAQGLNAFNDAETATALKLTDEQKKSIKGFSADMQKETQEIFKDGGFKAFQDPENQKKVQKIQKEYLGKAVDALTDDQKKTWKDLIGAEFDVAKLRQQPRKKD